MIDRKHQHKLKLLRFPSKNLKFNMKKDGCSQKEFEIFRPFTCKLIHIQTADGYIPKLTEL